MMLKPRDTAWRTGWRPHDCRQAGRHRLPRQRSLWDAFVWWEVTHHTQFESCAPHCMSSNAWPRGWISGHICAFEPEKGNTVTFVLVFYLKIHVSSLVCVQGQRKSGAVSQCVGVFGLGQGSLVLQDPNSALGDSYSKPTHSSIKPWTTSTFLNINTFHGNFYVCAGGEKHVAP